MHFPPFGVRSADMQFPAWAVVAAAVVMAFPFGWAIGILVAYFIAGSNFGQLPAATVPIGIVAAIVFALWPSLKPSTRLAVMLLGTAMSVFVVRLLP
jgi:hypothetical protein